jgi:hypothetical protein
MSPCLLKQTGGLLDASVGASLLGDLDEMMLTVNRLKLPAPLRRSVARTNGTTHHVAS